MDIRLGLVLKNILLHNNNTEQFVENKFRVGIRYTLKIDYKIK